MKLYELAEAYQSVLAMVQEHVESGEGDDELLDACLAEVSGAIEEKADGIAKVIRTLIVEADGYKAEADRIAAKARSARARADWLKGYLLAQLNRAGVDVVRGTLSVRVQAGRPRVEIVDADLVADQYLRDLPSRAERVDKTLVASALRDGVEVPGAEMVDGDPFLVIR